MAMPRTPRSPLEDLRGASRLGVEATRAVTELVQAMHLTIAGGPTILGRPFTSIARLLTAPVYGGIDAVARAVGAGVDAALDQLGPAIGQTAPGVRGEVLRSVLNGVLGDYLVASGNPLAIEMALHRASLSRGKRILLLVHGSCMSDLQWSRQGHDHGAALARDLGYTPVYAHYNSGLHVSTNGRRLAALLEELVAGWPLPIEELTVLAHSMGGLVARSACHAGEIAGHRWRRSLRKIVFLGTPHHGAALERGGSWVHLLLGVSRYSAPFARLARIRSAGITDLRFGNVRDDHWEGRDRFAVAPDSRTGLALPDGVDCHAVAASLAPDAQSAPRGDGLVTVDSALGRHRNSQLSLQFPESRQYVAYGSNHVDLLSRSDVYAAIRAWLRSAPAGE
jgi:pimeloyl-ACP methyl ester carboxylesterase